MMHPTTIWPFRRTPDTTIEPLYKLTDEEILATWKTLIPHELRKRRRTEYIGSEHFTEEMRQACSDRGIRRRILKQRSYVEECTPKEDGDETILRLYGEGFKTADVAKKVGRRFTEVRARLVACHPSGKVLR